MKSIEPTSNPDTPRPTSRREFLGIAGAGLLAGPSVLAQTKPTTQASKPKKDVKIRLAVVGGGFGAGQHWHEHPNCEVTAVTDLVEERRQRLQAVYSCDNVFPSLEVMLEKASDQFDAVAVFTDAPSHAKHALWCMDQGKHVTSACPVGFTLDEMAALKKKKEETGLRYMMHESSWYRQPCIAARELYADGRFGRLAFTELEYMHHSIGAKNSKLSFWQGEKSWRYALPPMLYPTHSLGLLVGVSGERIVKLSCIGQRIGDEHFPTASENQYGNPYDNEVAIGETDKGNICRFAVMWNLARGGERGQWCGEKMSCYMQGSAGRPQSVHYLGVPGWEAWEVPAYWNSERVPEPMRHPSGHGNSAAMLAAEFIDALVEDREPQCHIYDSIAMTAPGIVAHESAMQGGIQMEVPSYDPA